jgi:hypothetical protein
MAREVLGKFWEISGKFPSELKHGRSSAPSRAPECLDFEIEGKGRHQHRDASQARR